MQRKFEAIRSGSTVPHLTCGAVKEIKIELPPLAEQRRIVRLLDEALAVIAAAVANVERNLDNTRALFESHLQSLLTQRGAGWKQKTLKEIATDFGRGKSKHRPRNDPKLYNGKYPFIQTGDIRNADHYVTEYSQTYSDIGLAQSKLWPKDTLCITIAANIAETAILGFDACFPDSVIGLVVNQKEAESGFVEYLLQSFKTRLQAMGKGSAQDNINLGTFENERFPFPSVTEQRRITDRLDSLREETDRLVSIYERKLSALEALKRSLLDQAFSGELTKDSPQSDLLHFPTKIPSITTTDLHAGILAAAYDLHEKNNRQKHFGHVKAEKIAHMVEAHLGIDLDRSPIKDAAGPNDYPHQQKVEHRARKAGYFDFKRVDGAGYQVKKLRQFDALVNRARESLGDRNKSVDELLELMLPMTTQQAEICATVYAAWNNLILNAQTPTDEEIVCGARENWHAAKLNIPREKFFAAIDWLKQKSIVPSGKGKKVATKTGKK